MAGVSLAMPKRHKWLALISRRRCVMREGLRTLGDLVCSAGSGGAALSK